MDVLTSSIGLISSVPYLYTGCVFLVGIVTYYLHEVVKKPVFSCSDGQFKTFLLDNVPIINENFWPTIWCFEPRAQIFFSHYFRSLLVPYVKYKREVLQLTDGGQVALDWLDPKLGTQCSPRTPVVVILPGLIGTSQAEYVKALALVNTRLGSRVVVFNNRGNGGIELKTPRTYCASYTNDLEEVFESVKRKYPHAPMGCVGFSLGGLILGNYMAKREKEACNMLAAAMMVSVPLNVFKCMESIETPIINLLINNHMVNALKRFVHRNKVLQSGPWMHDEIMKSRTIREFDNSFTTKQFGYKDPEDYYHHATLHNKLHKIHVPTLCISARDDPFQPIEAIPIKEANNDKLAILVTSRGGHIAFMEGLLPFHERQYITRLCEQYFNSIFKSGAYKLFTNADNSSCY